MYKNDTDTENDVIKDIDTDTSVNKGAGTCIDTGAGADVDTCASSGISTSADSDTGAFTGAVTGAGIKTADEKITKAILWSALISAVFTSLVLLALLRVFGLLSLSGSVDFRGAQRSVASVRKLQQVWNALSDDFYLPVNGDRMIEFAAAGMVNSLGDVYSAYYTGEEMKRFTEHSSGIFHGIGVYVTQGESGRLRITGFLENSPALEAGVQVDDEIISVDGADVRDIKDSNTVIEMIKGEAGVVVTVGFYRPSDALTYEFPIERREIKTDNIFSGILFAGGGADGNGGETAASGDAGETVSSGASAEEGATAADTAIPVGYIYIKMFDGAASEYFNRHLDKLLESGIEALIIDLRGNPGGDFEETVKIADRLIGEGVIVYTEDRAGRREYRNSDPEALGLPIRILVDGDSASASEILAGALKDSGAGRLIGSKTFGKGLVQTVMRLSDGSGLKYTRSRYFTPSGMSIDSVGIEPDIYIEQTGAGGSGLLQNNPRSNDIVLDAALSDIEFVIDKAKYE